MLTSATTRVACPQPLPPGAKRFANGALSMLFAFPWASPDVEAGGTGECDRAIGSHSDEERHMIEAQTTVVLDEAAVQELKGRLCGRLLEPGDPDHESARKVYNGM